MGTGRDTAPCGSCDQRGEQDRWGRGYKGCPGSQDQTPAPPAELLDVLWIGNLQAACGGGAAWFQQRGPKASSLLSQPIQRQRKCPAWGCRGPWGSGDTLYGAELPARLRFVQGSVQMLGSPKVLGAGSRGLGRVFQGPTKPQSYGRKGQHPTARVGGKQLLHSSLYHHPSLSTLHPIAIRSPFRSGLIP